MHKLRLFLRLLRHTLHLLETLTRLVSRRRFALSWVVLSLSTASLPLRLCSLSVLLTTLSLSGCHTLSGLPSHPGPWKTSVIGVNPRPLLVGGEVTSDLIARELGVPTAVNRSAVFPLPPQPLPLAEILRKLQCRVEGGALVDDYAVVQLLVTRVSGGASLGDNSEFTAQVGGTMSAGTFTVPPGGRVYPFTQNISYFEGTTSVETGNTVNTTRKTINAGTEFFINWARIDNGMFRIFGDVRIASRIGEGLDLAETTLPFDSACVVGRPVPICEIVIASAEMAADLKRLTGRALFAGDTIRLSIQVR